MASGNHSRNWAEPVGGFILDSAGNPTNIIASFGTGNAAGETLLADNVGQSSSDFMQSQNHNHYGSGLGANNNAKDRGQYSGPGK